MVDLHCHILPGVDDGAFSLDESLAMARSAVQDGIEAIVATPHLFRNDCRSAGQAEIEAQSQELRRSLREKNIRVDIFTGSEVHISHHLMEEIKGEKGRLVINGSSYMFIEFPSNHVFPGVKNLLFELMSEGVRPIIAHPERNSVFGRNPDSLAELIQMGASAQANSGSFFGRYGSLPKEAVLRFLDLRLIHFIASDGHDQKAFSPGLSGALRKAGTILGERDARALVLDNPRAVLDDKDLPYRPAPASLARRSHSIKIPNIFRRKERNHP